MGCVSAVACLLLVAVASSHAALNQHGVFGCFSKLVSEWSVCDETCGVAGTQTRTVDVNAFLQCVGLPANATCVVPSEQVRPCNRKCYNGGNVGTDGCVCQERFWGKCCENCKLRVFTFLVFATSVYCMMPLVNNNVLVNNSYPYNYYTVQVSTVLLV